MVHWIRNTPFFCSYKCLFSKREWRNELVEVFQAIIWKIMETHVPWNNKNFLCEKPTTMVKLQKNLENALGRSKNKTSRKEPYNRQCVLKHYSKQKKIYNFFLKNRNILRVFKSVLMEESSSQLNNRFFWTKCTSYTIEFFRKSGNISESNRDFGTKSKYPFFVRLWPTHINYF